MVAGCDPAATPPAPTIYGGNTEVFMQLLSELSAQLSAEHRRTVHRLEARIASLEAENSQLKRPSQLVDAGSARPAATPAAQRPRRGEGGAAPAAPRAPPEEEPTSGAWVSFFSEQEDEEDCRDNSFGDSNPDLDGNGPHATQAREKRRQAPAPIIICNGGLDFRGLSLPGAADHALLAVSENDGSDSPPFGDSEVPTQPLDASSPTSWSAHLSPNQRGPRVSTDSYYSLQSIKETAGSDFDGADHITFKALEVWLKQYATLSRAPAMARTPTGVLDQDTRDVDKLSNIDPEEEENPAKFKALVDQHCRCAQRFMVQPSSLGNILRETVGLILVIVDILTVPVQMVNAVDSASFNNWAWFTRAFWTCDLPLNFFTGFVSQEGMVVLRPAKVWTRYARARFPLDALILSCDYIELILGASAWHLSGVRALRVLRLARLIRLLRTGKLAELFFARIRSEGWILVAAVSISLVLLLLFIHVLTCIWYGVEVSYGEAALLEDTDGMMTASTYLEAFCFVLSLFLSNVMTLPTRSVELVYVVTVLFFSWIVNAAFVGSLTTAMTRLQIIASQRHAQMATLNNYLSDYGISPELCLRVKRNARHALNEQKQNTPEANVQLLSLISDQLRAEIHHEVYAPVLSLHPFFSMYAEVNVVCARLLCHQAVSTVSLSQADVLFTEFEVTPTPKMFFLTSGTLLYTTVRGDEQQVSGKTWFAEPCLWTHWVHRGTMQAKSESRVLALDAHQLAELMGMYRSQQGYACRYAIRFCVELSQVLEDDLTDLGEEFVSRILATHVFKERFSLKSQSGSSAATTRRPSLASVFNQNPTGGLRRSVRLSALLQGMPAAGAGAAEQQQPRRSWLGALPGFAGPERQEQQGREWSK